MYEGFLAYGGNEVINNDRARGYAQTADCPMSWFKGPTCPGVGYLLNNGEAGDYDWANIADAPWYDPVLPDLSSRFYGAFGIRFKSFVDSTRQVSAVEGIDDGGLLGRTRKAMRQVQVTALLAARGTDALDYGMGWLSAALDPGACGQHGTECGVADLAFFSDCPGSPSDYTKTQYDITTTRKNLALNPSGGVDENGAILSWEVTAPFAIEQTEGWGDAGTAVRVTRITSGNARATAYVGEYEKVTTYRITAKLRLSTAMTITASMRHSATDTNNAANAPARYLPAGETEQTWVITTKNLTPTATASISFVYSSGAIDSTLDIADLIVEKLPPQVWTEAYRNAVANPSFEALATGTQATIRRNLHTNPGVETNTAGWSVISGSTLSRVTTEKHSGTASLQVVTSGASAAEGVVAGLTPTSPAGKTYQGGVWVKAPLGATLYTSTRTSGAAAIDSPTVNFTGTGNWEWIVAQPRTAQADTVTVQLQIRTATTAQAITFWLDDAIITEDAPVQGSFDGSTVSTDPRFTYAWEALPNESSSVERSTAVWVNTRRNLADQPVPFTGVANGWNSNNSTTNPASNAADAGRRPGTGAKRQVTAGASAPFVISLYNVGANAANPPVTVGRVYTGSVYVKTDAAVPMQGRVAYEFLDAAGARVGALVYGTYVPTPGNAWTRLSVTSIAAPTGAATIRLTAFVGTVDGATLPVGVQGWATDALIEEAPVVSDYFDGSMPASDFIYAWEGATGTSTSIAKGSTVTDVVAVVGAAVTSTAWKQSRSRSVRLIPTHPTSVQTRARLTPNLPVAGGESYTIVGTIRLDAAQPAGSWVNARTLSVYMVQAGTLVYSTPTPNAAGVYEVRFTVTVPEGTTQMDVRANHGGVLGSPDMWVDDLLVIKNADPATPYAGPYFDGATVSADPLVRYSWTGTVDASASIGETTPDAPPGVFFDGYTDPWGQMTYAWAGAPYASVSTEIQTIPYEVLDPDAYAAAMRGIERFLHGVGAMSGPIVTDEFESGEFNAYVVEFTLDAESPWVFSALRELALSPSLPVTVQDTPYNLVPYPSAELAGAAVVVSRNFSTNPSVETDSTGITSTAAALTGTAPAAYFTSGRSTELAAVGTASQRARILGNGTTEVASSTARLITTQTVPLTGYVAGQRLSFSVWAAAVISAGAAVTSVQAMSASVEWLNGSTVLSTDALGSLTSDQFSGGVIAKSGLLPPAGATNARVYTTADVTWRSSATAANNSDIRIYTDALLVSVP